MLWVLVLTRMWVCKIYISSRELEVILLNNRQKIAKGKHDVNKNRYLWRTLCLFSVAVTFLMNLGITFKRYFWGNDFCFLLLLVRLFEHFNLSILRISSHFMWEFLVYGKNVVVFSAVLCGANETVPLPHTKYFYNMN